MALPLRDEQASLSILYCVSAFLIAVSYASFVIGATGAAGLAAVTCVSFCVAQPARPNPAITNSATINLDMCVPIASGTSSKGPSRAADPHSSFGHAWRSRKGWPPCSNDRTRDQDVPLHLADTPAVPSVLCAIAHVATEGTVAAHGGGPGRLSVSMLGGGRVCDSVLTRPAGSHSLRGAVFRSRVLAMEGGAGDRLSRCGRAVPASRSTSLVAKSTENNGLVEPEIRLPILPRRRESPAGLRQAQCNCILRPHVGVPQRPSRSRVQGREIRTL